MKKEFNVIIKDYATEKIIIDCNIYAENEKSAIDKTVNLFKYELYKYNEYLIDCKAI